MHFLCIIGALKIPKEDFKTFYKSAFSSGGTIQNEIIPAHLDAIFTLLDAVEHDSNAIIPLRNKLRTLYIFYKMGMAKPQTIDEKFKSLNLMIDVWQKQHKNAKPRRIIELILNLAEDIFYQWNGSGAGVIFTPQDAQSGRKTYNTIIGRTNK